MVLNNGWQGSRANSQTGGFFWELVFSLVTGMQMEQTNPPVVRNQMSSESSEIVSSRLGDSVTHLAALCSVEIATLWKLELRVLLNVVFTQVRHKRETKQSYSQHKRQETGPTKRNTEPITRQQHQKLVWYECRISHWLCRVVNKC